MSYVNQDPDLFVVPFKGKHPVAITRQAWLVELDEGLSFSQADACSCWCGEQPGSCVDCCEDSVNVMMAKVNIGSGEDADMFR